MRLGVLVSGTGSILDAMLDAGLEVALVVADRPCGGLAIAERAGIDAVLVERDRYDASFDRDAYSARLAEVLVATASTWWPWRASARS